MNNVDSLRAIAVISVFFHHLDHVYQLNIPFFGPFWWHIGCSVILFDQWVFNYSKC